jgi:hypothetical protein
VAFKLFAVPEAEFERAVESCNVARKLDALR